MRRCDINEFAFTALRPVDTTEARASESYERASDDY